MKMSNSDDAVKIDTSEGAKYKILDTNVIINNPDCIDKLAKETTDMTNIIIPEVVITELDKFKKENSERGRNSRIASKKIKELQSSFETTLYKGIQISEDYIIRGSYAFTRGNEIEIKNVLSTLDDTHNDAKILAMAQVLVDKNPGIDLELITNDNNLINLANGRNIKCNELKKEDKETKKYKGWQEINSPKLATKFQKDRHISLDELISFGKPKWHHNEYLLINRQDDPTGLSGLIGRYDSVQQQVVPLQTLFNHHKEMKPKNARQKMALDALFDPSITNVSLIGAAGTAKTFLALYAMINSAMKPQRGHSRFNNPEEIPYKYGILTRPRVENTIGALPGELLEKLSPWLIPIMDNISELDDLGLVESKNFFANIREYSMLNPPAPYTCTVLDPEHARGANKNYAFWLIDEAQNCDRQTMKTLLTRMGKSSKMVLTGDPQQSDLHYYESALQNSLIYANSLIKTSKYSATVWFTPEDCERHEVVMDITKLLN